MGVMNPQLVMRNIIPVVMAGVLGIYGLIVAVIIQVREGERVWKRVMNVVVPMVEVYPKSLRCIICDPSTRRLGAMIKRQLENWLPKNYPEEQQRSPPFTPSFLSLLTSLSLHPRVPSRLRTTACPYTPSTPVLPT